MQSLGTVRQNGENILISSNCKRNLAKNKYNKKKEGKNEMSEWKTSSMLKE